VRVSFTDVKIAGIKLRARILAPFKNSDRENKIGTLARAPMPPLKEVKNRSVAVHLAGFRLAPP
jgi:hypothetical protein